MDLRPERLDLRPEKLDLRPERLDLRPERSDLRPERSDLRPEGPNEGGNGKTHKRKSPVFYRTSSPSGPLPKKREQVAQGQYAVSDTRCPALHGW